MNRVLLHLVLLGGHVAWPLPSKGPRSIATPGEGGPWSRCELGEGGVWKTGSKGRTLFSTIAKKKRVVNRICQIYV